MLTRMRARILGDERGIALPMALMIVLVLSALVAAFSVLGASEPTLAANQQRVAQARAIAESGVDRAIWALNNPDDPNGIPYPLVTPAAPYTGATAIPVTINGVQVGVFTVSVTNGAAPNQRDIVATGWVPSDTATNRVKQRIQVTVNKLRNFAGDAPAALTVRGEVDIGGNTLIDAKQDTTCGKKAGTWSRGTTDQGGASKVYGYDDCVNDVCTPGNLAIANQKLPWATNPTSDIVTTVPDAKFDPFTYTSDELNMLKAIAKANGSYYQGSVYFHSSNKMPNGVIFVDSVSGNNLTTSTPVSDYGWLKISGNPSSSGDGVFRGWIIVNGTATIDGNMEIHGLVYLVNDLSYKGTGTGKIVGAAISQNIKDIVQSSIDTDTTGNSTVVYNCAYAKNGDGGANIPMSFSIKPGTYKQVAG